ncbi:MAG: hypothetical protein JWM47_1545 [Acidimicrobiales bacterium]|nr:hypothetical protein [Acidimicrobiales bacterium]
MTVGRTSPTSSEELPLLTASPPDALFWGLSAAGGPAPAEVPAPVSVASDRFVKRIERLAKRDDEGLTQVSRRALEVLTGLHSDVEKADLLEIALLLEASAGDTSQLLRTLTNPERLPTDHGDLVVLDYLVLTPMLSRDPDNPRSILRLGAVDNANHFSYTSPVLNEYDLNSLRTLDFRDTNHFEELHQAQRHALGFAGAVRNPRDRLDLERGARLGILKPATVAPVRLFDRSTGKLGLQLGLVDANRRYTLIERLTQEVMPALAFGTFSRRHFFDGEGLVFRRFGPQDAHEARETLADAFADIDAPGLSGDPDHDRLMVAQWAKSIDDNHPRQAAILRTRVMRCRVAIGLDGASALAPRNPMTVAIGAYRDQLHLPELSDVGWSTRATEAMVGHDLMRRSREYPSALTTETQAALEVTRAPWQDTILYDPTSVSWHVPGINSTHTRAAAAAAMGLGIDEIEESVEGIAGLTGGLPPAVPAEGAVCTGTNVLDLVLSTTATLVCRSQPMTPVISEVLAHHRMHNSPKERGQLTAAVLLPLLNLPAEGPDTARAYASLSRTIYHGVVYKLDELRDPLEEGLRWVDLIGRNWFDVVDRARREAAKGASVTARGDRTFGPAQTLLAVASAVCLSVSPAVISSERGGPSVHQLTLSGLGGQRGHYKGDPLAVVLHLVTTDDGITQLWEAVVAAIAEPNARPARSIRHSPGLDPSGRTYGPFLTEVDLRDKPWGHGPAASTTTGGADGASVRLGAAAFVTSIFDSAASDLEAMAATIGPVIDRSNLTAVDPELDPEVDDFGGCPTRAFFADGIDPEVADRIIGAITTVQRAANQGLLLRVTQAEGA